MAKVFIEEETLTNIADSIRNKTGKTDLIDPALMSAEIDSIESGSAASGSVKQFLDTTKSARSLFNSSNLTSTVIESVISYNDTSNVVIASYMFYECNNLGAVPNLNYANVETASYMFYKARIGQDVTLNVENLTDATYMFYQLPSTRTITFEKSLLKLVTANYMFGSSNVLQEIKNLKIPNCQNISYMCYSCSALQTLPTSNYDSVTNASNAFQRCSALTSADLTLPLVTNAYYMFSECSKLQYVDVYIPKVTDASSMFQSNYALRKASIKSDNVATRCNNMFSYCRYLRVLELEHLQEANYTSQETPFIQCVNLDYLIIRNSTRVPSFNLNGCTDLFKNNPEGKIYITDSLVETAKALPNWSNFIDRTFPLSELPETYDNASRVWGFEKVTGTLYDNSYSVSNFSVRLNTGSQYPYGSIVRTNFNIGPDASGIRITYTHEVPSSNYGYPNVIIRCFKVDTTGKYDDPFGTYTVALKSEGSHTFEITNIPQGEHFIEVSAGLDTDHSNAPSSGTFTIEFIR